MSTALDMLRSGGFTVRLDFPDTLWVEPRAKVTPEMAALIRDEKPQIVARLIDSLLFEVWSVRLHSGTVLQHVQQPGVTRVELLRKYPGMIEAVPVAVRLADHAPLKLEDDHDGGGKAPRRRHAVRVP
jgi:hypothetical protein